MRGGLERERDKNARRREWHAREISMREGLLREWLTIREREWHVREISMREGLVRERAKHERARLARAKNKHERA